MNKHHYDTEDKKESIKNSILRISKSLGKTPTQQEYKKHRLPKEMSFEQITYLFGTWSDAIHYAGLAPNPFQRPPRAPEITKEELVTEFIRVVNEIGKIPGAHLFRSRSKYSWVPYKTKWGSWRATVTHITETYADQINFKVVRSNSKKERYIRKALNLPIPLIYAPNNENETIVLFALLAEELGYEIVKLQSDFPDAILRKDGKEILVEFEYLSSNYTQHCHPLDFKGQCICWRKDEDVPGIQIFSLEQYVREKNK